MRAYVFTDASLKRYAGRFVWLSMDTERADAAPFLEKFPVEGWPTLFVIDPRTERAALTWPGSATVAQLSRLLEDGERAVKGSVKGLDAKLAALDQAFTQKRHEEAARLGAKLAAEAPKDWPGRPRAVGLWINALFPLKQWEPCAKTALAELEKLPRIAAYADVVNMGLGCAGEIPKETAGRAQLLEALEKAAVDLLEKRDVPVAADDYSGMFMSVVNAREERGDEEGARAMTESWARYLEEQAEKAPSAEARTVFDSHRLTAYRKLKQPEKAVTMLQDAEKALPEDFNPPARLALAYRDMGRFDDALAASDRALARASGPRRLGILSTRAEIQQKKGDVGAAKKTLDDALAFAATLPRAQQRQGTVDSLKKQLEGLK